MNIPSSVTKEAIAQMPKEVFPGHIVVVDTPEELDKALEYLRSLKEIGFDTETRPSFSKKTQYEMSLLQLSGVDKCFLIRLNKIKGFPLALVALLTDNRIKKIGLSLRDDFHKFEGDIKITQHSFIDLQTYVKQFGIEDMSLRKIYAILFKKKISKRERLSNWETKILTEAQKSYAALDAWACLRIYQFLENLK